MNAQTLNKCRIAYVVVDEDRESEGAGTYLGIAHEGERGYQPLRPGFGPYRTWDEAQDHADKINKAMGLSKDEALNVIASTMLRRMGNA